MEESTHKKFIKDKLSKLGSKYDIRQVFEDFVICCAYSFANATSYKQEREDEYLRITKKYKKEEVNEFAEMLGHLQMEMLKEDFEDILGNIYEEFGLQNKTKGQFFTPIHICRVMAETNYDADSAEQKLKDHGYISVLDPCCGSGRMLLGYYNLAQKKNIDLSKIYFEGGDISNMCSCMTYVNLSLLGANAVVRHKDALSGKEFDSYITPALILNPKLINKLIKDGILQSKESSMEKDYE